MFPRPLALVLAAAALVFLTLPLSATADNCEGNPDANPECGGSPAPPGSPSPSPPPAPPPPAGDPHGWLDVIDADGIARGWACDPDDFSAPLTIHLYADGPAGSGSFVGSAVAGEQREPAVGDACGGYRLHGFSYRIPDHLRDNGSHTLYAYALNIGSGNHRLLAGSPLTFLLLRPTPTNPFPHGVEATDEGWEVDAFQIDATRSCKTVQYRRTMRSLPFYSVLWRMNLRVRWCWVGARIIESSAICFNSDVSLLIQANSCPAPQGQYFETPYSREGGWLAVVGNTYRNCLPGPAYQWTCFYQWSPTLRVRAYAGGDWKGAGGDG